MGTSSWAPTYGPAKFGKLTVNSTPTASAQTALSSVPTASADTQSAAKLWSPDNPLLWFGAIAGVTFGLMAFSTSTRVGKAKVELKVGDV